MSRRLLELAVIAALGVTGASPAFAEDRPNYVYLERGNERARMSGDLRDMDRAKRFQHGNERILWFRDGGQEYVIRDADTLRQADALWASIDDRGAMDPLTTKLQTLVSTQLQLSTRTRLNASRQATLAVRLAALDVRASNDGNRASLDRLRKQIAEQQQMLEDDSRTCDKQMRELGDKMQVVGKQIEAQAKQIEVQARKVEVDVLALLRRSIATGVAKRAE